MLVFVLHDILALHYIQNSYVSIDSSSISYYFQYTETGYLTFEPITLVPIQTKMIDPSILTAAEVSGEYRRGGGGARAIETLR